MKLIYTFLISLLSISVSAQTDVTLKINHKFGIEDFAYGAIATNNMGHAFKATRLEYYVTQITIIHDGGTETSVPLDVVALVQPGTEVSTEIDLGNYPVTTIESVKFYIGVYEPINNADPTLFDVSHPLGPKSPSMHWGWAAGYRFIAYEGFGGADFSQNFQLHGLGNENYFEVSSAVMVETVGGALVMNVNGDYAAGLNDIDLTSGTISHGTTGAAQKVLENWRDLVFSVYTANLPSNESINNVISIYPNPSQGAFEINLSASTDLQNVVIFNELGEQVQVIQIKGQSNLTIAIENAGIYMVAFTGVNGETVETKRIIVQ